MITQESIEALKARLDIVDVIGSYLELKKSGANFKAPCPFHDEKSPSFVVSPAKQIYHCFGCGAGGDSVKFVMDYEKLNYPEALEKLASTYNFTLQYTNNQQTKPKSQLFEVINDWYKSLLLQQKNALSYLKERGVYESSIEKFGIGYAPSSQMTINYLQSHLFDMKEAVDIGLIGYDNGRYYARFIERITFPIHTSSGKIVGFGGRTITGHQAKYINSPETPFFNKSRLLYAYHHARQEIYKKKEIIITEGYLDVIMLHQAGFENSVATLGTALTNEHLPLLRKGEPKIIMAYDGDNAGKNAAIKAAKLLSASGFDGGVVLFENGQDPADMVHNGYTNELAKMFHSPTPFIDFVLQQILSLYNLNNPKEKESALTETTAYLKTLSPLLQEEYKPYLASQLGLNPSFVRIFDNTHTNNPTPIHQTKYKDMLELNIIKTMLEYPQTTNQILNTVDPTLFQFHQKEFQLALHNQKDDPSIMEILIDDTIQPITDENKLQKELNTFMIKHYERELKKIQLKKNISFEEKAFYIRKLRGEISRLKKDNLQY
ncbi:DNA primase [hydrothermal vent metagenome]|uniref:DNA primase n=1 Tax=hydrothermal vent metagenome TaxID=652676 RepID=A0A1W1D3V3_9ZZZZ